LLFNLEHDHEDVIEGYLIPDGFSDKPVIFVTSDDGSVITIECDQERSAVVRSGRHATGIVGFRVDQTYIPNLPSQRHLAIHDAKTGLLIYRRPRVNSPIQLKLLRLDFSSLPMFAFDRFCSHHFQYAISGAESYGHETVLQVFHLNAVQSIYMSGRLMFRNYEQFLDAGFQVIADVPDPYYEMATRLFILQRLAKGRAPFIGDRDRILLADAVEHFRDVNLSSERELSIAFKKAAEKVRQTFASPTTRQLVCTYPDQTINRQNVAPAIDALSRFTVIGCGEDNAHFQNAVGELLGVKANSLRLAPRHSLLNDLVEKLRALPIAEVILEEDLILNYYLHEAVSPHLTAKWVDA